MRGLCKLFSLCRVPIPRTRPQWVKEVIPLAKWNKNILISFVFTVGFVEVDFIDTAA